MNTEYAWRKSSYSDGVGGSCLEIADCISDLVPVRDSKTPHGPTLLFPARAWADFITALAT
ncbi:DUF397 domain-containing protein [Streptomyces blastmyceticus]|uniref:DUF397 domain-containing protein n=1 Tax=Streptomyces blastmyceticus TaxID=68180 RepID=A0ABP3G2D8_9ACTN